MAEKRYCFKVGNKYDIGRITKCEIVKETAKTYVIRDLPKDELGFTNENTIKKSDMSTFVNDVVLTFEEAKQKRKEIILQRIDSNTSTIERLKKENSILEERLNKEIVE